MVTSIVIPIRNEVENIDPLTKRLNEVLNQPNLNIDYEIIFVDDGSKDGSRDVIKKIVHENKKLKAVFLKKGFGKSAALAEGFRRAHGDIIITMDGDLQDEPKEIPKFIQKINEGYDLVSGWKEKRKDPLEKIFFSKIFNFLVYKISGLKLRDVNCGFKAYRAWCVKTLFLSGNLYRFIPIFVARQGGRITEIAVEHHPRVYGKSKYGAERYIHGFLDLITMGLLSKFFTNPMYFFGAIALPLLFIGAGIGLYLLGYHVVWFFTGVGDSLNTRPLLVISIGLFGFGLNTLLVGALSEFLLQLYGNTNRFYTIDETLGFRSYEDKQ